MPCPEKILICDDQPMNIKLMARSLTLFGFQVLEATHGEEAIQIAKDANPDIILLDVMMPAMSGYEVTRILRSEFQTKNIPIVLITALADTDSRIRGLESGADDFLTKPVNQTELLTRVRSLIKLKKLHDQVDASQKTLLPATSQLRPEEIGQNHIILIIEDDAKEVKHIESHLTPHGYKTITVNNAAEALTLLDDAIPDLILLDLLLPDIGGIALLEKLRSTPELRLTSIIVISALGDLDVKVKSFDTGADDYIVKPINPVEMLARIKSNLTKYDFQKKIVSLSENYKATIDLLFKQSIVDNLTGLYNRHYLKTTLDKEIEISKRHGQSFCLLLLDLDHFKNINDTFGHVTGDSVLKELGTLIKHAIRTIDSAVRYGGEEFLIILPQTEIQYAIKLAERIRNIVSTHHFADANGTNITISIGATQCQKSDTSMHDLIKRADSALYKAKHSGRNRVEQE